MIEKLKSFVLNDHIFFGFIVILVGLASFGLGRASVINSEELTSKFEVTALPLTEVPAAAILSEVKTIEPEINNIYLVASKSGTKYHLLTCPGAKQIKLENKITFSSIKEAEAAGYKPAANCPGLQ